MVMEVCCGCYGVVGYNLLGLLGIVFLGLLGVVSCV